MGYLGFGFGAYYIQVLGLEDNAVYALIVPNVRTKTWLVHLRGNGGFGLRV